MALIPHKEDPNYDSEMVRYKKDNSEWAGDDLQKGINALNQKPQAPQNNNQQQQFKK